MWWGEWFISWPGGRTLEDRARPCEGLLGDSRATTSGGFSQGQASDTWALEDIRHPSAAAALGAFSRGTLKDTGELATGTFQGSDSCAWVVGGGAQNHHPAQAREIPRGPAEGVGPVGCCGQSSRFGVGGGGVRKTDSETRF